MASAWHLILEQKKLVYTLKPCVYNITSTPKDFGICIIIICRCSFLQYVTYRSYLTGTNEESPQKAQKEELLHRAKKNRLQNYGTAK